MLILCLRLGIGDGGKKRREQNSDMSAMLSNSNGVSVEPAQDKHLPDVARILANFLNSKHCFCCVPLGWGEDEKKLRKKFQKRPDMMQGLGVAIKEEKVLGFIQVVFEGMPCDLHKVKPGEAYVQYVAVDVEARGLGCGSKLLAWSEEVAKNRGCKFVALEVLGGNRAKGLYERKGFVVQPTSIVEKCEKCFELPFTCILLSPIICPGGSPPYCFTGAIYYMVKPLE